MCRYVRGAALLALLVTPVAWPFNSPAATSGWAWDSVTKIMRNADASTLQPGSFDADYAKAASVQPTSDSSGGSVFSKINQAMTMAKHMQALIESGFAERHYVAGSKERTDNVSEQTAVLVDCAARTITSLDLRKKTYRVVSMDQPASPGAASRAGSAPEPRATDDGTRVAITIANRALGARNVNGLPTNGFSSDMSFTVTKASGESQAYNGDLVGYYSQLANPTLHCSRVASLSSGQSGSSGARAAVVFGSYEQFMRALREAGSESRVSIKESGPPLPRGNLAMYEAATMGGGPGGGATFVTERGNLHQISANDPISSVPTDYTPATESP